MKNEQAISEVPCWSREPENGFSEGGDLSSIAGGVYFFQPGSQEFVSTLMHHKVLMVLVSTRPRKYFENSIGTIGIEGVFSVIVVAEDVHRGKPDPEMFIYAAQLLQYIPERCIQFGNSNQTVEAAHDAQMKCVVVGSKHILLQEQKAPVFIENCKSFDMSGVILYFLEKILNLYDVSGGVRIVQLKKIIFHGGR